MPGLVILGAQWGDEGKGKVVDHIAAHAQAVVRFQGGNNAGHTVYAGNQKLVLHTLPTGVIRKNVANYIGCGAVINVLEICKEMAELRDYGFTPAKRLYISPRAQVILPWHIEIDRWREKGKGKIGTTLRGIGPAYEDGVCRTGILMEDLKSPDLLRKKLRVSFQNKAILVDKKQLLSVNKLHKALMKAGEELNPLIQPVGQRLRQTLARKGHIIFEGAQGALLDLQHGTYPYVTSSNTTIGGVLTGSGVPPQALTAILGIAKAYVTRVGNGPFPTEATGEGETYLRKEGNEFGATTGRPRRCGWLDLPALRYSVALNGIDRLAITKLDVLDGLAEIPVCTGYRLKGKIIKEMPEGQRELLECEPVYKTFKGWMASTKGTTRPASLPDKAKRYLEFIQKESGTQITVLSTGPGRQELALGKKKELWGPPVSIL